MLTERSLVEAFESVGEIERGAGDHVLEAVENTARFALECRARKLFQYEQTMRQDLTDNEILLERLLETN